VSLTSYNDFVNNLGDIVITGVQRRFDGPPASVATADLYCSFPRAVEGEEGPLTVATSGGWPTFRAGLVIIIEPIGQDTSPLNHAKVVDMIDNISTALRRVNPSDTLHLGRGPISWTTILSSNEVVGQTQYWALVTTVEGHG
jgi:hypothetical protein